MSEKETQDDCRMAQLIEGADKENTLRYAKNKDKGSSVSRIVFQWLAVVFVIVLLVSVLKPSINGPRRAAKRVTCAANLKGIGNAIYIYANDYNDRFPPDLETLIVQGGMSPKSLISPLSDNDVYYCDYAYVPGLSENSPVGWILAFGDPNWSEDHPGANVLFVDGHAKYYPRAEFEETLQKFFNEYAEEYGTYPKIIPPHDTTKEFWESRGVTFPDWDTGRR